ncbi:MAG: hypothetical protein Q9181_004892 [Wetmoreana brouardii]
MSESPPAIDDVDPPWGSLAAENYLLQRWNPESSEDPDQQRSKLIREFVKAGGTGLIDDSRNEGPTAAQISTILVPWRNPAQRELASQVGKPAVWLRTCYSQGTDEKHEDLVDCVDMFMAVDGDERLLNDPNLYNFGADWHHVFDVLPELLERDSDHLSYYKERQRRAMEDLRKFAEGGLTQAPPGLVESLPSFQGKELEDYVAMVLQSRVHAACVIGWIVLEDEEALNSGMPVLLYLDILGRVVRSKRGEIWDTLAISGAWHNRSWREIREWEDAELGDDYKNGGVCRALAANIVQLKTLMTRLMKG